MRSKKSLSLGPSLPSHSRPLQNLHLARQTASAPTFAAGIGSLPGPIDTCHLRGYSQFCNGLGISTARRHSFERLWTSKQQVQLSADQPPRLPNCAVIPFSSGPSNECSSTVPNLFRPGAAEAIFFGLSPAASKYFAQNRNGTLHEGGCVEILQEVYSRCLRKEEVQFHHHTLHVFDWVDNTRIYHALWHR